MWKKKTCNSDCGVKQARSLMSFALNVFFNLYNPQFDCINNIYVIWDLLLFWGVWSGKVLIYKGIKISDVTFYVENRWCILVERI